MDPNQEREKVFITSTEPSSILFNIEIMNQIEKKIPKKKKQKTKRHKKMIDTVAVNVYLMLRVDVHMII